MLFVLFQIGSGRYAVEANRIAEVLPLMPVRPAPGASPEIAGVLSYRGAPLPVIDLTQVLLGQPAAQRLSTRILVVQLANGRQAGLIAERANETLYREPGDFAGTGVPGIACLGPVTEDTRGFVQLIDPDKLVHGGARAALLEDAV